MGQNAFSSNCYGYVKSRLLNTEDEFFASSDDLKEYLGKCIYSENYDKCIGETTDEIFEILENGVFIIEIFDGQGKSQHVGFLTADGKIYDQDGPDGIIREGNIGLNDLLYEYNQKFDEYGLGNLSYKIYQTKGDNSKNINEFLGLLSDVA